MKYEDLVELIGSCGVFDFAMLVQLTGERRSSLQVQLHRWSQAGKLLPLRRGMYALPERHRKRPLGGGEIANLLYAPSYLSTHWAIGYYGLIPEYVPRFTSVTGRKPAEFRNAFGVFSYRHVKQEAFFGFTTVEMGGVGVRIAEPEKALLDLWHLEKGAWDRTRMIEMRFQGFDVVDPVRLRAYAGRFRSPRVAAAAAVWLCLDQQEEARVTL